MNSVRIGTTTLNNKQVNFIKRALASRVTTLTFLINNATVANTNSARNERAYAFHVIQLIDGEVKPTDPLHVYTGELPGSIDLFIDEVQVRFYYSDTIRSAVEDVKSSLNLSVEDSKDFWRVTMGDLDKLLGLEE